MAEQPTSPFAGLDKALLRSTQSPPAPQSSPQTATESPNRTRPPRRKTTPPRPAASPAANALTSKPASVLASTHTDVIDIIRRTVKAPGREVLFVRLGPDEKAALADIVYTYKRNRRKTTETEIARIAVNFILQDYEARGGHSMLASVLDALLA